MKKYIKAVFLLLSVFFAIYGNDADIAAAQREQINYERDYLAKIYNSEAGIEGSAINCICSSSDGLLWIGGYTGLFRYDGIEFQKYLINELSLPVNDIVQDQNGNLWVGTNGDGVYRFDGETFTECIMDTQERGAYVINKLYVDKDGLVWAGTKSGIFSIDPKENRARRNKKLFGTVIHDIGESEDGEKIIVEKTGKIFFIEDDQTEERFASFEWMKKYTPRCCCNEKKGYFYIGTAENVILKVSDKGELLKVIDGNALFSFNRIYEFKDGEFWVCSDSGIGILKEDQITITEFPFNDSVEDVCMDFQGNFWFVSSRQGLLQIYKNHFSDLGAYWKLEQTANSIQVYGDKIYVGCDDGLYCFKDKEAVEDDLVRICKDQRIRQIYLDQEGRLWVSTFRGGIKILNKNGEISCFNIGNSNLTTNQIRCTWQRKNHEILVGTEEGLFLINIKGEVSQITTDEILNTKRILDIKEDSDGKIYVATDGYGVYVIKDNEVQNTYSKQDGMLSNIVMKVVISDRMNGIWAVTGEGLCFIDKKEQVQTVAAISVANTLDLLLTEEGDAVVLAGNGFFRLKEEDLFDKEISYIHFDKQDGLPIDFTANARNIIHNGVLYMCGTTGVASINLNEKQVQRPVILYISEIAEDGNDILRNDNKILLSSSAHRLSIEIRVVDYVHQKVYSSYFLDKMDKKKTLSADGEKVLASYTNLDGGSYIYHYEVYLTESKECLAKLSIPIVKDYKFWEEPRIKMLLFFCVLAFLVLLYILLIWFREKQIKKHYHTKFLRKKEEEISKLLYKDLVTGVYNRNYFEQEKEKLDVTKLYALFSVSINHMEYFKSKYGILYVENILRKGVQVIQECNKEDMKIFRVSENIFYFWLTEPVQLEGYIYHMKEMFKKKGEEAKLPFSFSIGAIYNNKVEKETIDELIARCGQMRILDEKHAEADFIAGKMKLL